MELLKTLKSDYTSAETVKNDEDGKVASRLKVYNSDPYGTEVDGKSKYVSSMTKQLASWQIPSLVEPFTSPDLVECAPVTHRDRMISEQEQSVLTHQLVRQNGHFSFMTDLATDLTIKATCFVKAGWENITKEVEEDQPIVIVDPVTGEQLITGYETVKVTKIVSNKPTRQLCDLLDIRMDPTCNGDISKASFVIHDYETDLSTLKKDGRYKNLEELVKSLERDETYISRDTTDDTFEFTDDPRKKFIVHEYWGNYDLNDDGIAEPILCAWVNDVIIREEDNPLPGQKIPFVKCVYTKVPNAIYGEALPDLTKKMQHIDSVLHRGIFDDMKLANNGQTGTKKGFTDDNNLKKMKKGQDFEYNTTMADVYQDKYQPIAQSVFQVLGANSGNANSISGIKNFDHGSGGNSLGSTAAAVNATTTSSAKREMQIIRGIAEDCIIPLLRLWSEYNAEFLSPEEVERITDNAYIEPQEGNQYDIKISIATKESKALQSQQIGFVLQTMGPQMPSEQANQLLAQYLKLNGLPEAAKATEEYKPQPDPMQQKIQELQIAKLEAELFNEQAKGQENAVDVGLKKAKTQTELAKAKDMNSTSDLKDLEFIDKESGNAEGRQFRKKEFDRKEKLDLESFKAMQSNARGSGK